MEANTILTAIIALPAHRKLITSFFVTVIYEKAIKITIIIFSKKRLLILCSDSFKIDQIGCLSYVFQNAKVRQLHF